MNLTFLPTSFILCLLALPSAQERELRTTAASPERTAQLQGEESAAEALAQQLRKARTPSARDEAFEALLGAADEDSGASALLASALAARWEAAVKKVASAKLEKKFARLVSQREELDQLRSHALALLEDEETYFYPYLQPDVSAKKAAEYPKVQAEVSKRVRALQKFWDKSGKAKVPKSAREPLEEMAWLRSRQALVPSGFELPGTIPAWAELLPLDLKDVTLASFPRDEKEAKRMLRDRRVALYNERVWKECVNPKRAKSDEDKRLRSRFPDEAEREQVRVTNAYRILMGRPSVTWDPRLQEATHHHSEYQARTGEFGHFQKDPKTRTPFDRMDLAGYPIGKSENCAKGATDPAAAHANWMGSSGHHRNLIMPGHKQMASAVSGNIWTQNYGLDVTAEKDL